ncbi:MAG: DNA polymerase III subunit gamma/tau, partial [Deinococcus sp.]|nr:DNA polymerase III subunit gamma/tau [Deinococcus sp.]
LRSAIAKHQLGQALVFSGPRGVGKTTTARLLAMAVNCPVAQRPCGQCPTCREIASGRHPDVLEIDAASHNSVDNVRELREHLLLAPAAGGTKVYILDEAHRMSGSAWDAFLKTLEEPPPGVLFIFATTEPEKVPPTVLSRCQHYRFRRLTPQEIQERLRELCQRAGIEAEPAALALLAQLAGGAMRDAETMLDRLQAAGEPLTLNRATQLLGLPPEDQVTALAQAVLAGDLATTLQHLDELARAGYGAAALLARLRDALRSTVRRIVAAHSPYQRAVRALLVIDEEERNLSRRADALLALETACLRAAQESGLEQRLQTLEQRLASSAPAPHVAPTAVPSQAADPPPRRPKRAAEPSPAPESVAQPLAPLDHAGKWEQFLQQVKERLGMPVQALVREATLEAEGQVVRLIFPESRKWHHSQVSNKSSDLALLAAQVWGQGVRLDLVLGEAKKKLPPPPELPPAPPEARPGEEVPLEAYLDAPQPAFLGEAITSHPLVKVLMSAFSGKILRIERTPPPAAEEDVHEPEETA